MSWLQHQPKALDDQPVEVMQLLLGEFVQVSQRQSCGFGIRFGHGGIMPDG